MEEREKRRGFTIRFLRVSWKYAMRYPMLCIGIIFVIIGGQVTTLFVPVYLRTLVDALVTPSANILPVAQFIFSYVLPIPALYLLSGALWRISGFIASTLQPRVQRDLLEYAFHSVMGQSYRFFSESFAGSLVRRVTSLPAAFTDLAESVWWRILPMSVSIFGGMFMLGTRSLILTGILTLWILTVFIGQVLINKVKRPFDTKRALAQTKSTGAAADAITNTINISLFSGRRYEERRFHEVVQAQTLLQHKSWRIGEAGMLLQNVAGFFCELAMLSIVIWYWKQGVMTVGDVVFVQGTLMVAFSNTRDLGRTLRRIYEAATDSHEILDIAEKIPEVREKRGAKKLLARRGEIEFKDVGFSYVPTTQVLKNFSLSISPKQKIALIGASGSGKTTVTKLLFRFFDIQQGSIRIDGQNISGVTLNSLRDAIAYVPQEPILFHRSLMENIRYSRRDATDAEVIRASKLAYCHEFIQTVPEGYQALVGERGIKLSGGERQRIAIARAILKNAPILVLDEATSSLDSESEALIQDALKKLMRNKTVIVIAHRLSTIMEMDRIIVMQDGRIVDEGTHYALRDKVGIYQKLWNIQAGGFQA